MQRPFKNVPTQMGIYAIRNLQNAKVFLGWSLDVNALLNRSRFELEHGSHANKVLQADWRGYSSEAFEFVVLDELKPRPEESPKAAYRKELEALYALWLEELKPYEERGYHSRP